MKFIVFGIKLKPYKKRVLSTLIIILNLFHVLACFWVIIGQLSEDGWLIMNNYALNMNSKFTVYLCSVYYIIQTVFTVGYGDIAYNTLLERAVSIFFMLIGVFIYSFIISSVTSVISLLDTHKGTVSENIDRLDAISVKYNLDIKLDTKIRNFFKENTNISSNEIELFNSLNIKMREELYFQINKYKLLGIAYFNNKSADFISKISEDLIIIQYNKGEYLYISDDIIDNLYFIKKGKVQITKNTNTKEIEILILKEGSYIGDYEIIIENINRQYNAKCISDCTFLGININKIKDAFKNHKDYQKEFIEFGVKRFSNILVLFEKNKNIKPKRIVQANTSTAKSNNFIRIEKEAKNIIDNYLVTINKNINNQKNLVYYHFLFVIQIKQYFVQVLCNKYYNKIFEKDLGIKKLDTFKHSFLIRFKAFKRV